MSAFLVPVGDGKGTASPPPLSTNAATAATPALGAELAKAEARQAKNLWVTLRAIDALSGRIARAKKELTAAASATAVAAATAVVDRDDDDRTAKTPSGSCPPLEAVVAGGGGRGGGEEEEGGVNAMELDSSGGGEGAESGVARVVAELAKDCEGLRSLECVGSEHKNFHVTISKLAKAADKQFGGDVESVRRTPRLKEKALHTAVITHLYRRGAFRAAARFTEDSAAAIPPDTSSQLVEMHGVLDALAKKNLAPAERWFEKRRTALEGVGSSLEFQLARLRFLCILQAAGPEQRGEAVMFAKERLSPLTDRYLKEIKELMGSLLWAGRLEESPYSHLLSVDLWAQVRGAVVVDGSRAAGLARESILAVAFRAGVLALPDLVKMAAARRGSNQAWDGMQELHVDLALPPGMRYHSMFACPVTGEPSTPGNPPVLLKCGHALLRSSVGELARNASKFKCPTCRVEQTENDTMILTL